MAKGDAQPAPPGTSGVADEEEAKAERRQSLRLLIVLLLIGAFFFVELIGAKIARSDVLEADAFHLLMDDSEDSLVHSGQSVLHHLRSSPTGHPGRHE